MSNESFYPLTPETLEKLYQANLTAAEWRLWGYLSVIEPWGERYKDLPDTLTVMEKVGIKKSTLYAAIAKFQKFGLFDFQDKGFAFRNLRGIPKVRNTVRDFGSLSEISENYPKSRNSIQKNGNFSETLENQSSEPLPQNDSSPPQTLQTYSDFKKTLSEQERENFENFVREEYYKDKGEKIKSFTAFMSNDHFQEWLERWNNRPEVVKQTQSAKWENHPLRAEWLEEIERTGNPAMFALSDKEKQAFVSWCWETKQFSWLKEEGK